MEFECFTNLIVNAQCREGYVVSTCLLYGDHFNCIARRHPLIKQYRQQLVTICCPKLY